VSYSSFAAYSSRGIRSEVLFEGEWIEGVLTDWWSDALTGCLMDEAVGSVGLGLVLVSDLLVTEFLSSSVFFFQFFVKSLEVGFG